jgi:benzoate-CoA ligase family protein
MLTYDDIPRAFNVASYFVDRNVEEGRGGRPALVCPQRIYSYAELAERVNRAGHALRELGVRREQRVLIAVSDGVEFVATWYAVLKIGAVVADVYTFLQPKDYEYYLHYSAAEVAVVDAVTLERVRTAAASIPWEVRLLVVGVGAEQLRAGEHSFESLTGEAPDQLEPAPTSKDEIAIWKFTTGSTGAPKAAVHCAHDPLICFDWYARGVLGYREDDLVLPVPKLFFGYARDATALFTFGVGAAGVVFPERSTPERIFELAERHRPTILVQVPTMMSAMVAHADAGRHDLASVRFCISAGEALHAELYRRWVERFEVEVLDGIGSSEAYHIYISSQSGAVRPGSVGQLVPGYEARIVDGEGRDCAEGEPGELWISGESTALMYWNDHQKSKRTFAGDLIRTGDLFARDADGYFWYRGRADDLLKVGGVWLAPLEIENCLLAHGSVAECAVVGHDHDGLVIPRAYVVLGAGVGPSEGLGADLQAFVRSRLAPHKYPREVCFVPELPKTASGKVDRKALQAMPEPLTAARS